MKTTSEVINTWAESGSASGCNPRYLHTLMLSGSGLTPELVIPPKDWFDCHRDDEFPVERVIGDAWDFLEENEDLTPINRMQIVAEIVKGYQKLNDDFGLIIWDTKPEHIIIQGFCSPDDVSQISIKFVDLETIYMTYKDEFSIAGSPTKFTLNSIARKQKILLETGFFDPQQEVIESLIENIFRMNEFSSFDSGKINNGLSAYWRNTGNCTFANFLTAIEELIGSLC
jgi:hypothetical protein